MKFPALDVTGVDSELLEAVVDDFSPTAVEQVERLTTVFFTDAASRSAAREAVARAWPAASLGTREVDDEDWARRSQESLTPISIGRVIVTPPWCAAAVRDLKSSPIPGLRTIAIVIAPSMGFGTGHHATTRFCLSALQTLDLHGRRLLDVGTGSGVLAIAGRALGAREAVGIDYDPDAVQAATENLEANPAIDHVSIQAGDLRSTAVSPADVVTANLTGALLIQTAPLLLAALSPGGTLIVSGLLADERAGVLAAFSGRARLTWEAEELGWVGLAFKVAFNRDDPSTV